MPRLLRTMARITVMTGVRAVLVLSILALVLVGLAPRLGGYRVLTVLSGSMRPTFSPGDVVIDRPVTMAKLRVGDVITYQAPIDGHPVISHRIIELNHPGLHPTVRTKGDANSAPDPWRATLGDGPAWRVTYVAPGVGRAIQFLRSPRVHTITTQALPFLLAGALLFVIWTPARREYVGTGAPAG